MAKNEPEKRIYLESNVLIDFIENPDSSEIVKTITSVMQDAADGRFEVFTSVLTIAEVWKGKEELDGKCLDSDVEKKLNWLWHPKSSPIKLVEVHELIAREAMRLLRTFVHKGYAKTRSADAIHLVTAQREGVHEFFTTEGSAKKWDEICGFKVCPPHYEPKPIEPEPLRQLTLLDAMQDAVVLPAAYVIPQNALQHPEDDHDWLLRMSRARQLSSRDASRFGHQRSLRRGDG